MTTPDTRALLKNAFLRIEELKSKLARHEADSREPIAIIGVACRFPAGAKDPESFWRALESGADGVRRLSPERWPEAASSGVRPEVRWAGLLDAVDGFDAAFFGISPREATQLDPQQRLLLEVTWEALERGEQRLDRSLGRKIGVFVGMCSVDYQQLVRGTELYDAYSATGNMLSTAAGRLSYTLGFQGPCMTIDTACSSSLVAVHLGCQSLRMRESELAVAGGVGILLDPTVMAMLAETQALSPDGRCRTFDARANGIVRGEGCGMVALKRLSDAERDGDPIMAVIRGSAVNQDGWSTGLTAPNVLSQEALLREALESARMSAEDIGYIETHGTGTSLGDPIEFEALRAVLGKPREDGARCVLGAAKSNIGHLEAAAGVAGLIKAVLCLQHGMIPKNLHFETLNPRISLDGTPFVIPTETLAWPSNGKPRRAGVSSFGLSGTNAHVILEEAPRREKPVVAVKEASSYLLALSAKAPGALVALASAYQGRLARADARLHDIAYTASVRRSHHKHRLAVVGSSKEEIAEALAAYGRGETPPGLVQGTLQAAAPKVVFVFPGQGSQWAGMGRTLLQEDPVFREAMEACDGAIRREAGFSVVEELLADEARSRLSEIDVAQPVLFAIEVALAALWRSWGVEPDAVVGHSLGEVAAAHVAGALSLGDAAAVVCRRSRLLRKVRDKGAMAQVELSMAEAERALGGHVDRLSVAASNGPRSTVIAGDPVALEEVMAALENDKVFCQRVKVDVASHSPQTEPLCADLRAALSGLLPKASSVPMHSTVTGERASGEELTGGYWADNLRKPVLFSPVVRSLIEAGYTLFIELSPHPSLLPSVNDNLQESKAEGAALASLRFRIEDRRSLLEALGRLYVQGYPVAFERLYPEGGHVVGLPSYPWQRERYWIESTAEPQAGSSRARWVGHGASAHPLLGSAFSSSLRPEDHSWEQGLSVKGLPYLAEHRVQGEVVVPGAGYVEMALAAGAATLGAAELVLEDVAFEAMLALSDQGERVVQVVVTEQGAGGCAFQIASRAEEATIWTKHASGRVALRGDEAVPEQAGEKPEGRKARLGAGLSAAEHYQRMRERQLDYGPSFQGLLELWVGEGEALGRVRLPEEVNDSGYTLHPALLDACLQVAAALSPDATETYVPVGIRRVHMRARPSRHVWVSATWGAGERSEGGEARCDMRIVDDEGRSLVELEGLQVRRLEAVAVGAKDALAGCVVEVAWRRVEPLPEAALPKEGVWLVMMDQSGVGAALSARLSELGQKCVRVVIGAAYERKEPNLYRIDPTKAEDYRRVLREALGEEERCVGAVHLLSLDATLIEDTTAETLSTDLMRGSVSAAYLAQAIVRHGFRDAPRLVLVTRGAQAVVSGEPVAVAQAPLLGLGKTIALEHPELRCTRIDLSPEASEGEAERVVRELAAKDQEDQIALRSEGRYVARLVQGAFEHEEPTAPERRLGPADGRRFRLEIRSPGVLDRLFLQEVSELVPAAGEVLIEVEAAGLNFRDVLLALGVLPDDAAGADGYGPRLGGECAGRVVAVGEGVAEFAPGQEVVASGARAFGSHMLARSALCVPKPARLSWEEAATLPVVLLTAYYTLDRVGRLQKGERVLIHAGAGGVGLMAIQWAKHVGAEIFATAGSEEKRAYLRGLGVSHVLDSRSLRFVEEIKSITKGEGVDVVLNSLSGEFIAASLSLLRDHGRFLEIGLRDYYDNRQLGLRPFLRSLSFSLVDLRGLLTQQPERTGALLRELMGLFEHGTLKPLPVRTFPVSQAAEAFAHMAQAKHIGKIALGMKDAEAQIVAERRHTALHLRADRSYLITGGLGGLGLSLARWFVEEGARHLVLVGRRGPGHEAQQAIRAMEEAGAQVECVQADVSRKSEVERLVSRIDESMPPLVGIVHAAAVLDDHTLLMQSEESFREVFGPKALGAWNLHALCEGRELDFFVMYSSAAALLGSPGQGNYTAANAFLDALSHERARRGLAAMSIQWGAFAEVGLAAAQENRGKRLASRGAASFTPAEGLLALRRLFAHPRAEVGVVRFDARQWIEFYPGAAGLPFLAEFMRKGGSARDGGEAPRVRQRLAEVASHERLPMLERHLCEQVATVLRLDATRIDRTAPFQSLGMDSLMSLELRNRIEASLGVRLSATLLFTYPNTAALGRHLLVMLHPSSENGNGSTHEALHGSADERTTNAGTNGRPDIESEVDQLSRDELRDALVRELEAE